MVSALRPVQYDEAIHIKTQEIEALHMILEEAEGWVTEVLKPYYSDHSLKHDIVLYHAKAEVRAHKAALLDQQAGLKALNGAKQAALQCQAPVIEDELDTTRLTLFTDADKASSSGGQNRPN